MSYFYFASITQSKVQNLHFKIISTLTSNREYIISSNNPINLFYLYWQEIMFIKLNKNTIYVNFNKHKLNYVICNIKDLLINREYIVIPIIPRGVT